MRPNTLELLATPLLGAMVEMRALSLDDRTINMGPAMEKECDPDLVPAAPAQQTDRRSVNGIPILGTPHAAAVQAFKETIAAGGSPKAALDNAKRCSPTRLVYAPHQGAKEQARRKRRMEQQQEVAAL